jgi:hypothetical protein
MMTSYRKGVRRVAAPGLAAALSLSLAAPAFAADATPAKAPAPPPAASGLLTAIAPAPLQFQQFADGTMIMTLGAPFLNITLAQRQPDGSIREFCVDSAAAANTLLTTAPAFEGK